LRIVESRIVESLNHATDSRISDLERLGIQGLVISDE